MDPVPSPCPECRDDPDTITGRYCPPRACYCGHRSCPSFRYYAPQITPEEQEAKRAARNQGQRGLVLGMLGADIERRRRDRGPSA